MKPMIKIHNATTGEVIEREMTDDEIAEMDVRQKARQDIENELAAKAQARQALLDKLGITEDEAKLLLGGN